MNVPSHVAIIMDGNGRWALEKDLARARGHRAGIDSFESILKKAVDLGISCLTVYAFSTENWKRPASEVDFLMKLFQETILNKANDLFENNVKVKIIGRRDGLPPGILRTINNIEELTEKNNGIQVNIAFNYGSRAEIVDVLLRISEKIKNDKTIDTINEELIIKHLYSNEFPEVELLIRTGGEKRLSNFMLWQSAYAELYFTEKYWPDFNAEELEKAVRVFQKRNRRFGGLTEMSEK